MCRASTESLFARWPAPRWSAFAVHATRALPARSVYRAQTLRRERAQATRVTRTVRRAGGKRMLRAGARYTLTRARIGLYQRRSCTAIAPRCWCVRRSRRSGSSRRCYAAASAGAGRDKFPCSSNRLRVCRATFARTSVLRPKRVCRRVSSAAASKGDSHGVILDREHGEDGSASGRMCGAARFHHRSQLRRGRLRGDARRGGSW